MKYFLITLIVGWQGLMAAQEAPATCHKGLAAFDAGNFEAALKAFNGCLKKEKNAINFYNRGKAHLELGADKKAKKDLNKALKLDDGFVHAYYALAEYHLAQEDFDGAAGVVTKAIELNPEDPYAYNFRGWVWLSAGKNMQAFKDFDRAIELDPNYASAYNNRGSARYYMQDIAAASKNDLKLARKDYLTALQLKPELPFMHRNLGCVSIYLEDYDTAHHYLQLAKADQPNDPMIYYFEGQIAHKQGKFKQALLLYDDALAAYDKLGGAWFQKGNIYYYREDWKAARYHYKQCLEKGAGYAGRAAYALAQTEARTKNKTAMLNYLNMAADAGYFQPLEQHNAFLSDRAFIVYRDDADFKAFLDRIRKK